MDPAPTPDVIIDLTAQVCPMTFVRTRLALDEMEPGQVLEILLSGSEPQARVPRTVAQAGHEILSRHHDAGGTLHLVVRKA